MKKMKILVTGGSGFIGQHVIHRLLEEEHEVTNLSIVPLSFPTVTDIISDFANQKILSKILPKIDAVIHLAAVVGVDQCRLHPDLVMEINYKRTVKLIHACIQYKVKQFLFSSSSEVYGNSTLIPYREDQTLSPVSVYGQSKVLTEQYLKTVQKKSTMHVGIVRFFNVYGPKQNPNFVIPLFMNAAYHQKPIAILGDGHQVRCFTYVDDAAKGLCKVLHNDESLFEIFNIGRKEPLTILRVAKKIRGIMSSQSKIIFIPYGNNTRHKDLEIDKRIPDTRKAKKILGFEASTTLEQGIRKIVKSDKEYYRPIPR